jgi:lysophospholipase L1-like esterase
MLRAVLSGFLFHIVAVGLLQAADPPSPFAKWEKAISAFEEQDEKEPPPKGAVLFVGSSSIRMWPQEKSFPKHATINRGFGGSQIADSVHFADRLVLKHEPGTIVFYAGDNDIARMKSPEQVAEDFQAFVKIVHEKLPKTKIVFIGIKPSLARWKLAETIQRANKLIQAQCEKGERLVFVDVFPPMLGDDGKPRPELFLKDGLHMTEAGYAVWTKLILPHLPEPERGN